ncbi:MAG TPA: bifunctional helix-turn-helix transcriptional regulator/GNAT family N-acetyltransferase [bacterium]|jgi:N-acetylglutamate synthase-like GNAT family acetyltransferase/DNA-binding MarR family transcriptional regulator
MDIFSELRELALASRIRRLGEMMMEEGEALYQELGLNFRPRWFPLFYALSRRSPLAITELAGILGLTHPSVNKIAAEMLRAGIITTSKDKQDDRRRLLRLSPAGRRSLKVLQPVWKEIYNGARDFLAEAGVDLIRDLELVERAFAQRSVADRVRERVGLPVQTKLAIVDYRPAYKKHFRSLNKEWLQKDFAVEKHDAAMLENPNRLVLRRGGAILFALLSREVVGTCALVRYKRGVFELCKMAVTPKMRRRGIGMALTRAAIVRARERGAKRIFLQTSPKLEAAIRLYRQMGFTQVKKHSLPRPEYQRGGITLWLEMDSGE